MEAKEITILADALDAIGYEVRALAQDTRAKATAAGTVADEIVTVTIVKKAVAEAPAAVEEEGVTA